MTQEEKDKKDYEDYLAYQDYLNSSNAEPQKSAFDKAKAAGVEALSALGRGLDYGSGVIRTGLAAGTGNASADELLKALKADPLTGDEILKRLGAGKGGSLSDIAPFLYSDTGDGPALQKGGLLDPSARGVAGFALETATDPLTYMTFGISPLFKKGTAAVAKEASQAGKALSLAEKAQQLATRPIAYPMEQLGKSRYASAFKKIDQAAKEVSGVPMSEVMLKKGMPTGNFNQLSLVADELRDQTGKALGALRSKAAAKGATIDMLPALNKAMEQASVWRKSPHPEIKAAAERLDNISESYLQTGTFPVDIASQWASEVNDLAKKVYGIGDAPLAAEGNAAIGKGISQEVKKSIKASSPEIADEYEKLNRAYSGLANERANKQLMSLAKTEAAKPNFSKVDTILGLYGLTNGPFSLAPFVGVKGLEYLRSPLGRTQLGKFLYESGKYVDPVLKRRSVWMDKPEDEKGN